MGQWLHCPILPAQVQVVFSSSWDFLRFLVTEYNSAHKLGKSEVAYLVERAAPVLLTRVGDKTQRGLGPQQVCLFFCLWIFLFKIMYCPHVLDL